MSLSKISNNYCPMRAFELRFGWIEYAEEHTRCGKKRCWKRSNLGLFNSDDLKLKIPKVDGPRDEDEEAEELHFPPAKVSKKKGSVYCAYRAWAMSRGWISGPEDHIYCGKLDCWKRYNRTEFQGMEAKVVLHRVDRPGGQSEDIPAHKTLDEWADETYCARPDEWDDDECHCPLNTREVEKIIGFKRHAHTQNIKSVVARFKGIAEPCTVDYFEFARAFPDLVEDFVEKARNGDSSDSDEE